MSAHYTILLYSPRWQHYQENLIAHLSDSVIDYEQRAANHLCFSLPGAGKSHTQYDLRAITPAEIDHVPLDFHILWCWKFPRDLFRKMAHLHWIQTFSAGVDHFLEPDVLPEQVVLTNAKGFHGAYIAEYVMGALLGHAKGLFANVRSNLSQKTMFKMPETLKDKVLGVFGAGLIGTAVARRARCFEMKTIGLKKKPTNITEFDQIYAPDQLSSFLKRCQYLVISAPLTSETRNLFNTRILNLLPHGAFVVNVGRGEIMVEADLMQALLSKHLAGAALDVWPGEQPHQCLFEHDALLVTPHFSALTREYTAHAASIFVQNLVRFSSQQELIYTVDRMKKY